MSKTFLLDILTDIHMALSLKDKGYQKIKIFEKTGRHGGKSYDTIVDGIYRPQGTIFLTADYVDNVIPLAENSRQL